MGNLSKFASEMTHLSPCTVCHSVLAFFLTAMAFLAFTAIAAKRTNDSGDRPMTVVIDPGHGGKDFGAVGRYGAEKDIVLSVGRALGQRLEKEWGHGIKVIYTRRDDRFIPLATRGAIANRAKGDLFVSIHVNSVDRSSKGREKVNGASVYTLGVDRQAKNLAVAKRENAVMVMEDDYTTRYAGFDPNSAESYIIFELEQNQHMAQSVDFAARAQRHLVTDAGRTDKHVRQAGFWVLHASAMPSVLVELDFICNPVQEDYLTSGRGVDQMSRALASAIGEYKEAYFPSSKKRQPEPEQSPANVQVDEDLSVGPTNDDGQIYYAVQFRTSTKDLGVDPGNHQGLDDVERFKDSHGTWKYVTGHAASSKEARPLWQHVRKLYPDAFIVRMRDGKRLD